MKERENIMLPLQRLLGRIPSLPTIMRILGMFADELVVPYFALLYWIIDKSVHPPTSSLCAACTALVHRVLYEPHHA